MKKRIFYSWQSDLPNNTNRGFINTALENAIKDIHADDTFDMIPFLDRDTLGLSGSPDISASIFEKIDLSDAFICDVSIINSTSNKIDVRETPNPNVLIELGYAIGKLGWHKIILIMNEEYGEVEKLPFDLRGRKVLKYRISENCSDKSPERKKVSSILKDAVKAILLNLVDNKSKSIPEKKKSSDSSNSIDDAAKKKLKAILNLTFIAEKNKMLIESTNRYIEMKRFDLAVSFAREITFIAEKNNALINIANASIDNKDIETAESAINGITFISEKNKLSMRLLELM